MGSTWLALRADLRVRWRAMAGLAPLLGLIGGVVLIPTSPKTGNPEPQLASPVAFRVSAVVTFDTQIVPGVGTNAEPAALLSPPFTATAASRRASYGDQAGIRLRPGASMDRFMSAA